MHVATQVILWILVAELLMKLWAAWPRPGAFFTDGWNVFDFVIVVVSLLPATGSFATVARRRNADLTGPSVAPEWNPPAARTL